MTSRIYHLLPVLALYAHTHGCLSASWAELFLEVREELNLSQNAMACRLGISKGSLSRLENGNTREPKTRVILALAAMSRAVGRRTA